MAKKAWKLIYSFDYGSGEAYWNKEMSVCCLVIPVANYDCGDDKPESMEAKVCDNFTAGIEWARVRLPEMYDAYKQWKEKQPDPLAAWKAKL